MNTAQLLAADLVLAVAAAATWTAAAWQTVSATSPRRPRLPLVADDGPTVGNRPVPAGPAVGARPAVGAAPTAANRPVDIALLLTAAAVIATTARYALLPALAAGGWWFANERITVSLPLTALPAAWAAMAGVPYLLRRRNTGSDSHEGAAPPAIDGTPGKEAAVLSLTAAAASALASLAVILVLGPFPAPWTVVVLLLLTAGVVLLVRLALFSGTSRKKNTGLAANPSVRRPVGARRGQGWGGFGRRGRPKPAAALAGLMACTLLGSGVFAWLGSRSADGAVIAAAVGHHDGGTAPTVVGPTPVTALLGNAPTDAVVRRYEVTARTETVTLPSGQSTEAWTFGSLPGPALEADLGDVMEVELKNRDVAAGVTLHWHGYDVPNAMDGVAGATQDAVAPGKSMTYRFVAAQPGTYWYHTHQDSAEGVRKGLYGTFVVHDPTLPRADKDIVVAGHDLDGLGMLGSSDRTSEHGAVPGSTVRVRLINTDSLPQRYLVEGTAFKVSAVDGTAVNQPPDVSGKLLRIGAGGRIDIDFTMPAAAVTIRSDSAASAAVVVSPGPPAGSPPGEPAGSSPGQPAAGQPAEAIPASVFSTTPVLDLLHYGVPAADAKTIPDITREEVVVLDRQFRFMDGVPRYAFTVNGAAYPLVPAMEVAMGDTVKVTVVNRTAEPHPMHPHGHHVRVLSRNGQAPTGSALHLDTVDVQPGEVWELLLEANNPGIWMDHCHNLEHAAEGMMMLLKYEGVSSPFVHGGHANNRPE